LRTLDVLSAHQDDAAYSIGATIDALARRSCAVRVLNVFTVSRYAPNLPSAALEDVCRARAQEDRAFLEAVASGVTLENLGRLDAPLRSDAYAQGVRRHGDLDEAERSEAEALAEQLRPLRSGGPILLPLALGNHIDHRIALAAGLAVAAGFELGFYEDLPYAAELAEEEIRARAASLHSEAGAELHPVLVGEGGPRPFSWKTRIAHLYASQLKSRDLDRILHHAGRLGGRERLWLTDALAGDFLGSGIELG
jgi:LmbE family N-acetylglucosaminyl deacetylase